MGDDDIVDTDVGRDIAETLTRAAIYRLLAASLTFPSDETRAFVRAEVFPVLSGVATGSAGVDDSLPAVMAIHDVPLDELRRGHGKVFTHIDSADCPSYESAFCPGDIFRQAEVMADVAAFYRAHGLEFGGQQRERPDHIAIELEFMAFLARKQAHAMAELGLEEVDECERSQRHFLRDHLGCWSHAFATRLQLIAATTPFEAVGRLVEHWIADELDWLGVEPVVSWIEPQPMPERDDGSCGVDGTGMLDTPVELSRR